MPKKVKSVKPPKLLKVKEPDERGKYREVHPHLPRAPFLLIGAGSVRSGKTCALIGLLRDNEQFYGDKYWDKVVVYSNSIFNDPKCKYLEDVFEVHDGFSNTSIEQYIANQKKHKKEDMPTGLLVFDDIIHANFSKGIANSLNTLATRFRHINTSIMIFVQQFRAISPLIRANATDIMIFKQQSSKQLETIAEEYEDLAGESFMDYYNQAINDEPYSFLYIDAQKNPAEFFIRWEKLIGLGPKPVKEGDDKPPEEPFDKEYEKPPCSKCGKVHEKDEECKVCGLK